MVQRNSIVLFFVCSCAFGYGVAEAQTRLYLPSTSSAPAVSPSFDADWEVTTTAVRRIPTTSTASTAMDAHPDSFSGVAGQQLGVQFVYGPLASQTIDGTVKGQVRVGLTDSRAEGCVALAVAKVDSAGNNRVELLTVTLTTDNTNCTVSGTVPPSGTAEPTYTNRRFEEGSNDFALNLTSQSINDGDYFVVEVGSMNAQANAARYSRVVYGDDSGTDLAENETTTTANNPWVEFSDTISLSGGASTPRLLLLGVTHD